MKKPKTVLTAIAFALCAGAIGWGVLADSRTTRLEALLSEIEAAEDTVPYEGIRHLGTSADAVQLKISSQAGRRRVEFLGFRGSTRPPAGSRRPFRVPFFGGIPAFLRPGDGLWRRKIKDVELAVRNYDVRMVGRETVAGREADVIELRARHGGRASYRVAADVENRFPLEFRVIDGERTVFESRFQSITFHPAFGPKTFEEAPPRRPWVVLDRHEAPVEKISRQAGYGCWLPTTLPAGFEQRGAELLRVKLDLPEGTREAIRAFLPLGLPRLDRPVIHVNYTDGISVFSVVECPADWELWKFLKRFLPAGGPPGSGGQVVARKFADAKGSAYLLELDGTVVLLAGNIAGSELEPIIPTLERR
jgi:hypothetical protein